MNGTNVGTLDENNENILIYIMLGIEILNALICLFTTYKLGYINLDVEHIKICCCEFYNIHLESESEDNITKEKNEWTR